MPGYFEGKVVFVTGSGSDAHRGVAVALAGAGADIAVGGEAADLAAEAALHSIANEIWALGRRSMVVTLDASSRASFAEAVAKVQVQLGRVDLVVRCDPVMNA